jgi:hypothetical protein
MEAASSLEMFVSTYNPTVSKPESHHWINEMTLWDSHKYGIQEKTNYFNCLVFLLCAGLFVLMLVHLHEAKLGV